MSSVSAQSTYAIICSIVLTIREGALITGFPKEYKFYGSHSSRCMQIGNAIPVNMAKHIALKCKDYLDEVLA